MALEKPQSAGELLGTSERMENPLGRERLWALVLCNMERIDSKAAVCCMAPPPHEITQLLKEWSAGDKSARDRLIPLVYDDLHRLAQWHMAGEGEDHTLQATALVHEAYLRLVDSQQANWKDRAHFFAVSARLIRNILVDAARSRRALKRGADPRMVESDEVMTASAGPAVDLIALDLALDALTALDPRKSKVLEMRIFGGLSAKETAGVLQISTDTVTRDMHLATAWLRRELGREDVHGA
jgi:RNA polymerase sigma factor (TIGR02999 family)